MYQLALLRDTQIALLFSLAREELALLSLIYYEKKCLMWQSPLTSPHLARFL
jgi:hypothetical protein